MVIAFLVVIFHALNLMCLLLTPRAHVSYVSSDRNTVDISPAYGIDLV